jgi:prepilin-type processing-associated H-X9-DG protein
MNNLKQMGLAALNYENVNSRFPPGRLETGNTGIPGTEWSQHARILPYLEQESLGSLLQFHLDPDDPANDPARNAQPATFLCPSDPGSSLPPTVNVYGRNNYRGNAGNTWSKDDNNGLYYKYFIDKSLRARDMVRFSGVRAAEILDGTSNTAMFSERALGDLDNARVTIESDWFRTPAATAATIAADCRQVNTATAQQSSGGGSNWANGSYAFTWYNHIITPNRPSCMTTGNPNSNGATAASSYHPGGVNLVLCDGSTRFVQEAVSEVTWQRLGNRRDGQTLDPF